MLGNLRYVHDFVYGDGVMGTDIIKLYTLHVCSSLYINYISINLGVKSKIKNLHIIKPNLSILPHLLTHSIPLYFPYFFSSLSYKCYISKQSITKFCEGVLSFSLIYNWSVPIEKHCRKVIFFLETELHKNSLIERFVYIKVLCYDIDFILE